MIVHSNIHSQNSLARRMLNKKNDVKYRRERESWKEWLRFYVSWELIDTTDKLPISRLYINTGEYNFVIAADAYWLFPLVPFVFAWRKIIRVWVSLARFCYKRGYLGKVEEGTSMNWFWPKMLWGRKNK